MTPGHALEPVGFLSLGAAGSNATNSHPLGASAAAPATRTPFFRGPPSTENRGSDVVHRRAGVAAFAFDDVRDGGLLEDGAG